MAKLHVKNRFWITPNEVLTHKELSWKAKGIYWYIQSKPETWEFAVSRISKDTADGEKATISGIKELENAGFLERRRFQNELWHWEIEYILYETPVAYNRQEDQNPPAENPPAENPLAENRQTYKEESNKKEIEKKISFADFWNLYPKKENKINSEKKWEKLNDKTKTEVLEALQKVWNPYWVKKYGTAAGLPTDYIKAPDSWLHNRKWEEVPGKIANTASTTTQALKPTGPTEEEKRRSGDAAEHAKKVEQFFKNLPEEEKQAIRDEAQQLLEKITTEKSRADYPKQAQLMKNGKIIQIVTQKYLSTH